MKKMHIISHTHWDREWYLNSKYTNEWLVEFFEKLFLMLDKEPTYQFVLDGQTMLLEDYYVELRKKGISVSDKKAKLQKFVQSGNIFIGPLYNQPDWQLVSEESLVKNLVLGNQISKEYGDKMKVGWLLDNFGQISQTSQILENANLIGIYVWRGVEMDPKNVNSEFLWEAPNGTKLPTVYLLDSYRNGMRLAEHSEIFDARVKDTYKRLLPFATTNNLLMLNGYDQEIGPDDVLKVIKNHQKDTALYQLKQSNPEEYIKAILSESPRLQTLSGALYSGRFISVFPGVLSARMYLKQQNHFSEKLVETVTLPLATMNWLTGGEYNENHLDAAYKKLLMNQPHDSICGCSIDDVHKDMETRTDLVNIFFNDEIDDVAQKLISKIKTTDSRNIVVFNTTSYDRDIIIADIAIKNVPAFGYKVVRQNDQFENELVIDETNLTIDNKLIKVVINKNGSIDLTDKETKVTYHNLGLLKDKGDSGDEYNYSYPDTDTILTTKDILAKINFVKKTKEITIVKVTYDFEVPKGLNKSRTKRLKATIVIPVTTYITVKANSKVVEFETDILNTAKNHLISTVFETNIKTKTSQAGAQFDVVTRKISYADFNESEIPENVREVIIGAREPKPNKIFPHREFVDLTDNQRGLAVLNKGLPEFTINEDKNTIELTLFRSVEWVASDINSRLGDAGPKIYTPDAQCLRQMKFSYAVYPHRGNYEAGNVIKEANSYNIEPIVIKTDSHDGKLPQEYSFLKIIDPSKQLKVTAFKRSLDSKSIIVRLYNGGTKETMFKVASSYEIIKLSKTNFLEENEIVVKNNLLIKAKEILTLKIALKRVEMKEQFCQINRLDFAKRENYSNYKVAEYVTEDDIKNERSRATKMAHLVNTPDMGRTALEAQLSAVLTNIRKEEEQIKELGYKLNSARVNRRVWDYIKKYHQE